MNTIEIKFTPLLQPVINTVNGAISEFMVSDGSNTQKFKVESPGVYIWGFLKENDPDFFLPYYVGEATTTILERINRHKSDIEFKNSPYVRLSKDYMTGNNCRPYWYDREFPKLIRKGISDKWCQTNPDKAIYWQNKYPLMKDWKSETNITDTLCNSQRAGFEPYLFYWDIITGYKDFNSGKIIRDLWGKLIELKEYKRDFLEIFEAYIKFSLRGKTISSSISVESMKNRFHILCPDMDILISDESLNLKYFHKESLLNAVYHDSRIGFGETDPYTRL
jgi:hypothetical protein